MSSEPIAHYAQEISTISAISSSAPPVPSADQPIRAMIAAMISGFISLISAATWQNHRLRHEFFEVLHGKNHQDH